ncbi:carbohydrate ABC transporter permease [Cellulomonas denverensis]|uniref:Sugar ABC transporter permease n=1 Tax=Cellulomonas denverensis TaxID=264297 RepID=A0A7X6QY07_9CELL|nr:sugar ABC transporter permease [Cellulomonas denverensis]NKY21639.1 sugar ABC transporter permease [Cellulomonas denverensis]GIG25530.1 sugar ABC transporter permease [Cellulomonas denverensis]
MTTQIDPAPVASGPAVTTAPRSAKQRRGREGRGWPFVVPFLVIATLFLIVPTLYGLGLSFTEQSLMGNGGWVGLDNYAEALSDSTMWATLGHTIAFTVMSTVPLVLVALVMALLVYTGLPGQWLWRLAFFAPYMLPVAVVVQIWVWLFQPEIGFLNYWLDRFGLDKVGWLTDTNVAMWSMVLLTLWWTVGFNFLLYLSALQAIPDQMYEAAALDGAGSWRRLFSITLPQLKGTTVLITVLQLLASLKVFDQMFIAFNGGSGPGGVTRPILQYIYDTGFTGYRMGYASAMSYIFFALIIVVTVVFQAFTTRRREAGRGR